jgi:hypothetical protein
MISSNIKALVEADDRRQERRERLEAELKAAGIPEPVYQWHPPDPTRDVWDKPIKPKRNRRKSR